MESAETVARNLSTLIGANFSVVGDVIVGSPKFSNVQYFLFERVVEGSGLRVRIDDPVRIPSHGISDTSAAVIATMAAQEEARIKRLENSREAIAQLGGLPAEFDSSKKILLVATNITPTPLRSLDSVVTSY